MWKINANARLNAALISMLHVLLWFSSAEVSLGCHSGTSRVSQGLRKGLDLLAETQTKLI